MKNTFLLLSPHKKFTMKNTFLILTFLPARSTILKQTIFFIAFSTIFLLQSCGTFLDVTGKGAKTECLSMDTGKQTIDCNCGEKQISSITIYKNKSSKENFGTKTHQFSVNPAGQSFILPISTDSLNACFLQIEIHLTDSHWRESYYIKTEPGSFSKSQKIYSRYFSH